MESNLRPHASTTGVGTPRPEKSFNRALVRTWNKRHSHTADGNATGPITMENSLAIYAQVKYTCILGFSNFTHMNIPAQRHTPQKYSKKLTLDQLWYRHIIVYTEDK